MPYYTGGDYYGQAAGDYYRGGDFLGLGKLAKKVGGGLLGGVGGFLVGGPAGAVAGARLGLKLGGGGGGPMIAQPPVSTALSVLPPPAQRGLINIGGGFEQTGLLNIGGGGKRITEARLNGFGGRRHMNPMNAKALKRASRRIDGFVRTARRALKHTQYTISRRGARLGSRGVITRAEAARALRK